MFYILRRRVSLETILAERARVKEMREYSRIVRILQEQMWRKIVNG